MASAAFKAWRDADPTRGDVSRFDLEVLPEPVDTTVDFAARAHELGIHLFPNSNYPFVICVGALFLALAGIPFPGPARIAMLVIGGLIFLYGVVGWVLVEDVRMYPVDTPPAEEVHH
jgi:prophage maintenance system killer protein